METDCLETSGFRFDYLPKEMLLAPQWEVLLATWLGSRMLARLSEVLQVEAISFLFFVDICFVLSPFYLSSIFVSAFSVF